MNEFRHVLKVKAGKCYGSCSDMAQTLHISRCPTVGVSLTHRPTLEKVDVSMWHESVKGAGTKGYNFRRTVVEGRPGEMRLFSESSHNETDQFDGASAQLALGTLYSAQSCTLVHRFWDKFGPLMPFWAR